MLIQDSCRLNIRDYLRHISMETRDLKTMMDSHPLTVFFSRTPRPSDHCERASSHPERTGCRGVDDSVLVSLRAAPRDWHAC